MADYHIVSPPKFSVEYQGEYEYADDYEDAFEIALDWSVQEAGASINILDNYTGQLREVVA